MTSTQTTSPLSPLRVKRRAASPALALTLALAFGAWLPAAWAQSAAGSGAKTTVVTPQVRAELMAHAPEGADAGKTIWVGLQLTHQPEWHTYWKNSGDSGQPTSLTWTLPPGVDAGEIAWPAPKKIPIGTLANYGYENTVLLPVPLTISSAFKPSLLANDIEVKLKAAWLVCKKECIPEEGEFALRIPVKGSTALNAAAFDAAQKAAPRPLTSGLAAATPPGRATLEGSSVTFEVQGLPVALRGKTLDFFPETPEVIETAAAGTQAWSGAVWRATVPLSAQRSNSPALMPVVLAAQVNGVRESYRADLKVAGNWPTVTPVATMSPALEAALKANAASQNVPAAPAIGLIAALLGALLGGVILNLMPCVFPVLAIKVMSFAQHADDQKGHRASALAYSAGVVVSFVALGALMLALRSAGEQLGWGFQLQSPAVVATLAALFTVIGLNLAGLFEFGMFLPTKLASAELKNPVANSFLSGVLAVAIASPCTAPFMGASLGLAVALPSHEALLIFAMLGVGMALPFALAGFVPAIARALPRPGAWMETFRRLMAFPMFATVVWLVWVLGQQSGIDGAGAMLALLVALAFALWALTLKGRGRLLTATVSIAACVWLVLEIGPYVLKPMDTSSAAGQAAPGERWQPWEPGRVDQLLAANRPVFVDFTAAWCVTCQVNKKTTLTNAQVLADFDAKKVTLLRADWTRRDPAITAALAQLGRNGVPLYVVYKPGAAPVLLSELLSVDDVRAELAKL
jgi:thiol:disulfide interchange protein/DsbC/DsbD-like thiol-disulfide interchange protein